MENVRDRSVWIRTWFVLGGWIQIRFVLRGWIRIRFVLRSGSGFGQYQTGSETLHISIQNIRLSVYIAARFSPRNRV